MIDGELIVCPNCALVGKKQVLGKVLTNGDLLILRFHSGTTIVKAIAYSILCGCGYNHSVSGAVVTSGNQQNYVDNDRSNYRG